MQLPRGLWKQLQRLALDLDVSATKLLTEAITAKVEQLSKRRAA